MYYNNRYPPTPLSPNQPRRRRLTVLLVAGTLIIIAGLSVTLVWAFFISPSSTTPSPTTSTNKFPIALVTQDANGTPSAKSTATPSTKSTATPSTKSTATPSAKPTPVPQPTTSPSPNVPPLSLKQEPEGISITAAAGKYENPFKGSLGGKWLMFFHGDYITITGRGYFLIRWEVGWFNRVGLIVMPTWTNLNGTLLHVASGGGHRMDDLSNPSVPKGTWMGTPQTGYDTLPPGTPMIWQNEFYYLNGTVTLHENEMGADYNLSVTPKTWSDVTADVNHAPTGNPWIRYGVVYDH